jgi:DNA-binding Xre family transcriptional regulator
LNPPEQKWPTILKSSLRNQNEGSHAQNQEVNKMANRLDRYYKRQMQTPEIRNLVEKELVDLELGITIARLREQENLNQTQLAARAGMNASKISLIETSTRNVTLNTLARVAHALNTRIKIEFVPMKANKSATVNTRRKRATPVR